MSLVLPEILLDAPADTGSHVTWMQREPNIELSLIEECFETIFLNPREYFLGIFFGVRRRGIVCIVIGV
jgi:hypothetical protein